MHFFFLPHTPTLLYSMGEARQVHPSAAFCSLYSNTSEFKNRVTGSSAQPAGSRDVSGKLHAAYKKTAYSDMEKKTSSCSDNYICAS